MELKELSKSLVKLLNEIDESIGQYVNKNHPLRHGIHNMLRRFELLTENDDLNGGERFAFDILEEALAITDGNRQDDYGSAIESFQRIADFWSTYLAGKLHERITPVEVAQMMVLLKVSRSLTSPKRDTFVDQAGYSRLANVITEHTPF